MLTDKQVALIKGMAARGDYQMDIGAALGVNQGRVNEVLVRDHKKWERVAPAPETDLPPTGPYAVVPLSALTAMVEMASFYNRLGGPLQVKLPYGLFTRSNEGNAKWH